MTSAKPSHLLNALPPNTVELGVRYEFGGGGVTVCFIVVIYTKLQISK